MTLRRATIEHGKAVPKSQKAVCGLFGMKCLAGRCVEKYADSGEVKRIKTYCTPSFASSGSSMNLPSKFQVREVPRSEVFLELIFHV